MTQTAPIAPPARLVVFGATGQTGRRVLHEAIARGYKVRAVDLKKDGLPDEVEAIQANVLEDDLAPALSGAEAIISCLGVPNDLGTLVDPPPLYSKGTARIAEAMGAVGLTRIAVISANFVAANNRGPLLFRVSTEPALTRVLADMQEMEETLAASGLDWTAVRPGWLMDAEATGEAVVTEGEIAPDLIRTRTGDLAAFLIECVEKGLWSRATPALARREAEEHEGNAAVLRSYFA